MQMQLSMVYTVDNHQSNFPWTSSHFFVCFMWLFFRNYSFETFDVISGVFEYKYV